STGYTRQLLDIVLPAAATQGYLPDASVTPDEAGGGRPKPFMRYRNAILLGVYPLWHCVKIGDTPSDIDAWLNAGMCTSGTRAAGNEGGLSEVDWDRLAADERCRREQQAAGRVAGAGAHFTAPSLAACSEILEEIERRLAAGEKP